MGRRPLRFQNQRKQAPTRGAARAAKGRSHWRSGDGCFSPRPGCRAGSQLAVRRASATRQTSAAPQSQVRSSPKGRLAKRRASLRPYLCAADAAGRAYRRRRSAQSWGGCDRQPACRPRLEPTCGSSPRHLRSECPAARRKRSPARAVVTALRATLQTCGPGAPGLRPAPADIARDAR